MKIKLGKIIKTIWDFIEALTGDNVSVYAAQASFFLIISSIPFLLLVFTVVKLFWNVDTDSILHIINSFAPADISMFITTVFGEIFDKSASVSVISVTAVITLWLSSRGIMALYNGLNSLHHKQTRNYFIDRLVSLFYTLAFLVVILLTIIVFGFGAKIEQLLNHNTTVIADIMRFLSHGKGIVFFLLLTLIFALFYKFFPRLDCPFTSLLPGAALAAAGWLGFTYIYSVYIENFSNYTYFYGSVAAIVLLMLWVYFCMNIFLYGAQINKMIKNGFFSK